MVESCDATEFDVTTPAGSEWMCQKCKRNPVPALGETLCADCAAEASAGDRHAEAIERAKTFLESSDKATAFKVKDPSLAIALALQGILVCQIVSVTRLDEAAPAEFMMPFALPEPEPEMGPKPWGQHS